MQRDVGELGSCLVTGGAGYLGRHLAAELMRRGHPVRVFDVREDAAWPAGAEAVVGDVTRYDEVRAACEGIDSVFHTAAQLVFLTFRTPAIRRRVYAVNVSGVSNVLHAAAEAGVSRLVYTSSNNVTLDGPVIDGDESTPYAHGARDIYTETKIRGEQLALGANDKHGLLTCAVRPGGIYGPGDSLMLPRLVEQLRRGRFVATIGDGSAMSDNTFIDNLVDGQICAARHLVPGSPTCGQAYYVTDGAPINYFDFFRPIVEGLGYRFPRWKLPVWPMRAVAWLGELLHVHMGLPAPPLSRHELSKIVVSHYNRIDKARRDLGWEPPVSPQAALERCLPYCRELLDGANDAGPRLG